MREERTEEGKNLIEMDKTGANEPGTTVQGPDELGASET